MGEELFELWLVRSRRRCRSSEPSALVGASLVALSVPGIRPRSSSRRRAQGRRASMVRERTNKLPQGHWRRASCVLLPGSRVEPRLRTRPNGYACKRSARRRRSSFRAIASRQVRLRRTASAPSGSSGRLRPAGTTLHLQMQRRGGAATPALQRARLLRSQEHQRLLRAERELLQRRCSRRAGNDVLHRAGQCATQADRTELLRGTPGSLLPEGPRRTVRRSHTCCPPGYLSFGRQARSAGPQRGQVLLPERRGVRLGQGRT